MSHWTDETLPVLEAARRVSLRDPADPYVTPQHVNDELGRSDDDLQTARGLHDLAQTG